MSKSRYETVICFVLCFVVLAAIQWWSGASQAAFDGYPDEPSHYLSGLMVHDYLVSGIHTNPHQYAMNYYLHLPFFAVGYWPPFFYLAEGAWMTVVGYSRPEALLFMAFIAALTAATIFAVVRSTLGTAGAFCCALLFLLLPDVLSNSSMVMTDTMIALLSFWSLLVLARYFETPNWRDAILFSFLAACTIMTKYSGLYLALIPPLCLLTGRRWDLLRRPSLWVQPLLVAIFCAPWILLTHQYAMTGFASFVKPGFWESIVLNLQLWVQSLGPWLSILLFGAWVYQAVHLAEANWLRRILWIQPPALIFFQSIAPVCCETRWLISGLAPLIVVMGFVVARLPKWYGPALVAAAVVLCSFTSLPYLHKPANSVSPVVKAILQKSAVTPESLIYVPCDEEGLVIAEFAMRDPRRPDRVLARPNKLLASMDWLAHNYKASYDQPDQLERYFEENPPDLLILHPRAADQQFPHERLLQATIHDYPNCWRLLLTASGHDVYQYTGSRKPGADVITPLFRSRVAGRFDVQ